MSTGQTNKLIDEMQGKLNDIQTEAARLVVFANSTPNKALGARLKKIGRVIFKSATGIEKQLEKLKRAERGSSR